ncbi:hypothetical protein ACIQK6_30980 [Streptomyces sp. NPDC091682]|uniref:hypothetical protein n=1 Tax=Streptomyces sp. NPDC091682 TaxID=3366005 RepID=UPI002E2E1413|nr:hypothetical protein [Streptomyces sp. NBC_01439]
MHPGVRSSGMLRELTDAELVTLTMMQAMLGVTSEAGWLRHAHAHLRHLFPCLPKLPGYNKRPCKAAKLLRRVTRTLATDTSVWSNDVWILDSTPVDCASHSRFFWGFRLHLVCTLQGLPVAFTLA